MDANPTNRNWRRLCDKAFPTVAQFPILASKREAFSSRLWHSRCVTVLRDQFQDYVFANTFFELNDLCASFVGLQEYGLADIFLQFFKSKHCVLAGIQSAQAEMSARIGRISLVKIRA